jgi:predicted CDP-diglyceride synthetase/phosphatidate cytidylyltransferase
MRRPPATVNVASVLTILLASVGSYGAIYFSGLDGYGPVDATFLSMYCYLSLLGIASVIAQWRGSALGQAGTIVWALFMALFTLVKLVTIQETEAISFGVVALIVVALELAPPTRRFIRSRRA